MTEKRQEEQQHLKEAEAARQSVSILEKEQQERQNEVNRLKELDLATEDGLFRAGNEALQNEQNAQKALNDAQNRINQAINQKAEAENIARDYENKAAQAEAKRQKHSNILEEFVKWNTEADYGKEAWWKEYNGWMDSIANLEKERDDAKNAARESVNKVANLLEQANNDKANAENALNNARNTLADIQARKEAIAKAKKEAEDKAEEDRIKDAIKTVADFYKETTEKFGEQSAKVAKELADAAKGSTIKNSDHALQLFDKHRDILNKKFNAKDREAVAKALESVNRDQIARNLAKFSKAFFVTSKGIDAYDLYNEFQKGYKTNNWRPFFVKTESIYAGAAATALTAFAYSIILGTPLGILGYAIIMTLVSVFVNEKFVEKINSALGI
ncbi:colicin-like pore-forming protein [Serratia liquefaciens]|uniref:colicin-like pore-forming protein n=1 Tax=Serratia liquefaciens TaxID=614 RepID=UPI002182F5B8|nr:colicin-like pore-forming protein [Serratia liquefaciens]CAI2539790.1 Colicin-Ia [Serratia liquefaciens]